MIYVDNTGWASLDGKLHMIKSVNSVSGTITIETDTSAEVTALPTPITAIIVHAIEWQEVCFSEFTPNPGTPGEIDTTTMCDTERRNLPGLATPGTANFTGMFDLDDEGMLAVIAAKDAATARFMVGTTRLGQAAVFHGIVSSASIGSGAQVYDASSISSWYQRSRPAFMCTRKSATPRLTTITDEIEGVSPRASSAICLSGTMLPRR